MLVVVVVELSTLCSALNSAGMDEVWVEVVGIANDFTGEKCVSVDCGSDRVDATGVAVVDEAADVDRTYVVLLWADEGTPLQREALSFKLEWPPPTLLSCGPNVACSEGPCVTT